MVEDFDQLRMVVDELYAGLEWLPYHVFLGVDEKAEGDALREAFHERVNTFHPDRFDAGGDEALRKREYEVYKRITEAYRVLGDPELRAEYEEQRAAGKSRLDRGERARPAKRAEDEVADPKARRYYQMALEAERAGDLNGARIQVQLALSMSPGDPVLRDKLDQLKRG